MMLYPLKLENKTNLRLSRSNRTDNNLEQQKRVIWSCIEVVPIMSEQVLPSLVMTATVIRIYRVVAFDYRWPVAIQSRLQGCNSLSLDVSQTFETRLKISG